MIRNIRHHLIVLLVIFVVVSLLGACTTPTPSPTPGPSPTAAPTAAAQPITLKAVTFMPPTHPRSQLYKTFFADEVSKRSNGQINIQYLGGPEVVGVFDQGTAVSKGVVDFSFVFANAYIGLVPAARAFKYTTLETDQLRSSGAFDWMASLHEQANIRLVGFWDGNTGNRFYFFLNKRVTKLEDLKGLRIASETTLVETMPKFGMQPVPITDEELYTALQQRLVDGFINPMDQVQPSGLQEVTKFCLEEAFIKWGAVMNIMNLDSWKKLPKNLQDIITQVQIEGEQKLRQENDRLAAEHRELLLKSGMEFTKLPPDEAKVFLDTINKTETEFALSKISPDVAQKFIQLMKPY